MDPIDEIEGGDRRSVQESAQRRSAFLRGIAQKAQRKPIQEAMLDEPGPSTQEDSLDFSSEFSSQDMGLDQKSEARFLSRFREVPDEEDGEGDSEDEALEDEAGFEGESSFENDEDDESEFEVEAEVDPEDESGAESGGSEGGAVGSEAPQQEQLGLRERSCDPEGEDESSAPPPVEERLGYSWGPVSETPAEAEPEDPPEQTESSGAGPSRGTPAVTDQIEPSLDTAPRIRPEGRPLGEAPPLEPPVEALRNTASLLLESPPDTPGYGECLRLLARFGQGALRMCLRQRVKVKIYSEEEFRTDSEIRALGLEGDLLPVDGAYLVGSRTCLLDRRALLTRPSYFHPVLYYFAHALDHAQGGETFSSRKAPAVRACYESFSNGSAPVDFVDELAAADPTRYFARSVSIYLSRNDCGRPLWTREDLRDFDRAMYDYLEYLFGRFEE